MNVRGSLGVEARRREILLRLESSTDIDIRSLADEWELHPMTIRRDFDALAQQGLARRVRGGLIKNESSRDFSARLSENLQQKQIIGDKLQTLLEPGETIALDASTTMAAFASKVSSCSNLTVLTNGIPAFQELRQMPQITALLTGGMQEEKNESLVGMLAEAAVRSFALDKVFISVMGIEPVFGLSEMTADQASFKSTLVALAKLTIVAVDASKLETRAKIRSFPLTGNELLVTELRPDDSRLAPYRDMFKTII